MSPVVFEEIKKHIKEYKLDGADMLPEQFKILLKDNKLAAFGRLLKHGRITEVCSVGVIEEFRKEGLGKVIVKELLNGVKGDIYLVTVIPDFFIKLGFEVVTDYPELLQDKADRCHHDCGMAISVMKRTSIVK